MMTLDDTQPCPGRSDMGRLEGECVNCGQFDRAAPARVLPEIVKDTKSGEMGCSGRRSHGVRRVVPVEISAPPRSSMQDIVSVISRKGDK